jgi:hypothetical protein
MIEVTYKLLFALWAGHSGSPLCKVRAPCREVFKQDDLILAVCAGHGDIPPTWFWFDRAHVVITCWRGTDALDFEEIPFATLKRLINILASPAPYAYRRIVPDSSDF